MDQEPWSSESSSTPSSPPGWYIDANGVNRWWDGTQWGASAQQAGYGGGPGSYYQNPVPPMPTATPPPPPWGTWTWADGTAIDINSLPPYDPDKKLITGLLAILLSGLGIHKFILGNTNEGIITIVVSLFTCGLFSIIPIIEGIIYLTKSNEEFYWTYVVGKKKWF